LVGAKTIFGGKIGFKYGKISKKFIRMKYGAIIDRDRGRGVACYSVFKRTSKYRKKME
jgi:hypothetical protein